jgi:L-ascorbate metabolism protein UlaG (beta-lactamase superfamily)
MRIVLTLLALTATAQAAPAIEVTWLGHAAFELVSPGGTRILVDPWLVENPAAPAAWKDLTRLAKRRPDVILVTHAHGDHADDVPALAKLTGAKVLTCGEQLRAMKIPEAQQLTINVSGSRVVGDVTIHAVPAMHSNEPNGRPLGFVMVFPGGRAVYHTGDTGIFGDMALIEELHRPEILLVAVGGGPWGMSAGTAALAVKKYFRPRLIVPMHFGTFPELADEAAVRKAFAGDARLRVLARGEPTEL